MTDTAVIETDGTTVWVHNEKGITIARFGKLGIDVHTAEADGCLHCVHGDTSNFQSWCEFVAAVYHHHKILVDGLFRPRRCALTSA